MSCVFVHKSNCNFKNVLVTPAPVSCLVSYTVNVEIFVKMSKISVHVKFDRTCVLCIWSTFVVEDNLFFMTHRTNVEVFNWSNIPTFTVIRNN